MAVSETLPRSGGWATLANPARFTRFADAVLPWLSAAAILILAIGTYLSFFASPDDYQQGSTVRIMYVHVPSAWLALFTYVVMAAAAIGTLVWRHPLADVSARAAAPIGATFTFIALVTGAIWGEPMWGTWWVWDARLTSMLILFFMYLGLIALWYAIADPIRGARAGAVLILVGFINIPIIKFSVDWWNTLHQPASVFRFDGPTIHASMLWPLMVMAIGFMVLFAVLHLVSMKSEILRRRIRAATLRMAAGR